jgi:hypothetical protein
MSDSAASLSVTAGGTVSQTLAFTIPGTTTITSSGNVVLDNLNNDFIGPVNVNGADVVVADRNALAFSGSASQGLVLQAGTDLTLRGVSATGAASLLAGGRLSVADNTALTLANAQGAASIMLAGGAVSIGAGSTLTVGGGLLSVVSDLAATPSNSGASTGYQLDGAPVNRTASAIFQGAGSAILSDASSTTTFHSRQGGSIVLEEAGNRLSGHLGARVDCAQSPCIAASAGSPAQASVVSIASQDGIATSLDTSLTYRTATGTAGYTFAGGISADSIMLKAPGLSADGGTASIAPRVQLTPADQRLAPGGTILPSLQIEFAGTLTGSTFGTANSAINVDFGAATAGRSPGLISVIPLQASALPAGFAIYTRGPLLATPSYRGFGLTDALPVFYNGRDLRLATGLTRDVIEELLRDAQIVGAFASIGGEIEEARRRSFEEMVRTENVAGRLRRSVVLRAGPAAGAWDNSGDAVGINVKGLACPSPSGLACGK